MSGPRGYLGLAAIQPGFAFWLNGYWILGTLFGALLMTNFFVALREKDKLRETFGECYNDHVASTRRWV